jgi:hypothetical protein
MHALFLHKCKGVECLDSNEDGVSCREIDWDTDLSFAYQGHYLIANWEVAHCHSLFGFAKEDAENIADIFILA